MGQPVPTRSPMTDAGGLATRIWVNFFQSLISAISSAEQFLPPPYWDGTVPGLTMFPNLQGQNLTSGWSITGGTATSGGSNTGAPSVTFGNAQALTADGSIALTSTGNGFNSQIYYLLPNAMLPSSNPLLITNATVDLWLYLPSNVSSPQALEGPNVPLYNGTHIMYPSIQADSASGFWRLWNGSAWVATAFSCISFLATKDQWQHIQVHYQFNAGANQFTYQDLIVNSVPVFQHLGTTYTGALDSGAVSIKTQVQIDNTAVSNATTVYYDGITTRLW